MRDAADMQLSVVRSGGALRGATHRELQLQEYNEVRHKRGAQLQQKSRVDTGHGTYCPIYYVYILHFLFGVPWDGDERVTGTSAILSTVGNHNGPYQMSHLSLA